GSTIRIYINGELDTAVAQGVVPAPSVFPFQIGSVSGRTDGSFFFPGPIDEVHIFNRALSDTEIQVIVKAGKAGLVVPPDLTVIKTHSGNFIQGQTAAYSVTVSNVGGTPTSGMVTVIDTLPVDLTATAIN